MNLLGFTRLMYMIYGKGPVDLDFIQEQGLLAVKIGQIHALRIDFLDPEKCRQLAQLYRHTASLPAESFHRLIAEHAPEGFLDAFDSIEETPFASASIGQVHRGRLKTGEVVAVKLVKSDYTTDFRKDVKAVELFFRALISFYPKLKRVANPLGILEDIRRYTLSELDLRNELRGQETLRALYDELGGDYDLSGLGFLTMYPELSGENVLVSEYIDGVTLDEMLEQGTLTYERLLRIFFIVGVYMFRAGTFHGDIHPGNIMVRNGTELVFVDNGSLGYVEGKIKEGLFAFFDALSHYDFPRAATCLNKMSERELTGQAYDRFLAAFLAVYEGFEGKTVSEVSLTRQMMLTIKLGVNSGMEFDKGMFSVVRALMYLDGMVLRCAPDAVLMEDIRTFVESLQKDSG